MKSFILILHLLLATSYAFSQQRGTIVIKSGENIDPYLADSLQYILPNFSNGIVTFMDGSRSQAILNINTVTQSVRFIEEKSGDTLSVVNEKDIESIYVMNRYFLKKNTFKYFEILSPEKEISIAINRLLKFEEPPKEGAYGTKSHTTSISTYNEYIDHSTGRAYNIQNYLDVPWKYSVNIFLKKGDKLYLSNKKHFKKIFPKSLSPFIEKYIKDNDLNLEKEADTKNLLKACEEQLTRVH